MRLGTKVLVVGASEAGLTKLGEVDAADLPQGKVPPKSFGDVLSRALSRKATSSAVSPQEEERP